MAKAYDDPFGEFIRAARQLVQTERDLAGDALPVGVNPLPEIAFTATAAVPAATAAESALSRQQKADLLAAMDRDEVRPCARCGLSRSRTQTVFADGDADAELMFIGEGPGADEDAQGLPFVGKAGQLLNKMIAAMGLGREQVYIANVVKCRPPGNRTPLPDEAAACWGYLERQIRIIQPKVIVVLGNAAAKALLNTAIGITRLRGNWQQLTIDGRTIPVMPTFHPAYLLRQYTEDNRRRVWNDLQSVMDALGLKR